MHLTYGCMNIWFCTTYKLQHRLRYYITLVDIEFLCFSSISFSQSANFSVITMYRVCLFFSAVKLKREHILYSTSERNQIPKRWTFTNTFYVHLSMRREHHDMYTSCNYVPHLIRFKRLAVACAFHIKCHHQRLQHTYSYNSSAMFR